MIIERLHTPAPSPGISLLEKDPTEHDVRLHEFLAFTFPEMPKHGLVSISTMERIIAGLCNQTTPKLTEASQYGKNALLWLRGGAVWDAIYGKDPHRDAPRRLIERYAKDDSTVTLPPHVIRTISRYTPDIDIRADFVDGVGAYNAHKQIENIIGFAPTQYTYRGKNRNMSFFDPINPRQIIQIKINDRFGDLEGKQKRIKIKIKFIDGDRHTALDISQDTEKDEGPFFYNQSDMRLNAQRTLLDVLGTFPVSRDGGNLVVSVNRALDATGVHGSFNPFYPAVLMRRGYSHAFSSLMRAATKAAGKPYENKFLSEQPNEKRDNNLFDRLLTDAVRGDRAMCDPNLIDIPTEGSYEENNLYKRAMPTTQVDITYALIRNPFRFLRLLFAMKQLCATLPLGNLHGDEVLEKMRALLAERTGQPIDTLDKASEVYEQYVLAPGTNLPTGLEMLAEITENQDVLALFTPNSSQMTQK